MLKIAWRELKNESLQTYTQCVWTGSYMYSIIDLVIKKRNLETGT